METNDSRAVSVEENLVANPVPEIVDAVPLPEGITQLTDEEIAAATEEVPEEVTPEQAEAMIKEAYAKAEAAEKVLTEALAPYGTYLFIRFENPTSMRHVIKFSEPRPQDRTTIAVFEKVCRELKAYETRAYWKAADDADKELNEDEVESKVTKEILKRGLPNNRATRRKIAQDMGL